MVFMRMIKQTTILAIYSVTISSNLNSHMEYNK